MTRPFSVGATALATMAAVAGIASCGRSKSAASRATIPVAQVSQQYLAVIQPANTALTGFVHQALGYLGGSPAGLDADARKTAGILADASPRLDGIAAPDPIQRDIGSVATDLNTLTGDLDTLAGATGGAFQTDVARLVADAGREMAADNLVRLALSVASAPTTPPPATLPAVTVAPTTTEAPTSTSLATATTTTTATTTVSQTTTTRPRTTTTVPPETTTVPPTTVPLTTTTTKPKTTTTNILHLP